MRRTRAGAAMFAALAVWLLVAGIAAAAPPPGPPYPDPVTGQRVYDYAGIFSAPARARAEATSRAIEERTGAQVAVYTQVKPESDSEALAEADALALMNQWGVGRKGFDDGLVILFDMQDNLQHGQVNLYAGSGFKAAFLTNAERQAIFDSDMKPLLKAGNFDAALDVAMARVDAAATPEHAASLQQARQINALVGIGGLALAVALVLLVIFWWARHGRDPFYLDDNSILMPAPPPDLTPAMATLLMADRTTSRTASAGLVDLAANGAIGFRDESGMVGHKAGIEARGTTTGTLGGPERQLNGLVIDAAALRGGYLGPGDLKLLASAINTFKSAIEDLAVERGWLTAKPSSVVGRWIAFGIAPIVAGGALIWWTLQLDASGGILGGIPLILAGIATMAFGYYMPARTRTGAMLTAMLAAYRRTLQKTLEQARSMGEVVASKALPWVNTPDGIMAWGVAFGLDGELDGVLKRGLDADRAGAHGMAWYPIWWAPSGGHASGFAGGGAAGSAGLFSAGAMPDVGGMMSALGSIGSASSGGGGGGFGGGGGGGGGGAGGGF